VTMLEAQVEKLKGALEPFARVGRHPHPTLALISGELPGLTDEEFRAAAAILDPTPAQDGEPVQGMTCED
jgi:hypothetical protein